MAIDPRGADLQRFLGDDTTTGELVMLNLLRFADGGRTHYEAYAAAIQPFLAKVGGSVVYAGLAGDPLVAEAGQGWDAVVIVRYPDRRAFMAMVADPGYQAITHLRTRALRETVLQPTTPWWPSPTS
jgi:uncharacterized protein (DUF1330 family)